MKGIIAWLMGVPIFVIILLYFFDVFSRPQGLNPARPRRFALPQGARTSSVRGRRMGKPVVA